MDKQKNKDDLRAAGKKRLELFRSKRSKAGTSKPTASTPKPATAVESHPGELNEGDENSTVAPLDSVHSELSIHEANEPSFNAEVPDGVGRQQGDFKVCSADPSKCAGNGYTKMGTLAVDEIYLEIDKTVITHSEKIAEIHHLERAEEMENSNERLHVESTERMEGQLSKELHETDKHVYMQPMEMILQPDNTVQVCNARTDISNNSTLQLSLEVEELKGQVDKVTKEKHQLLVELEHCMEELHQSIEDRNRVSDDLQVLNSQIEEMSKEGAASKAELHHKLAQEKRELMEDWKDVKHKLKNIFSGDVIPSENQLTISDEENDFFDLKNELERDIGLLATAFREANEQLQVQDFEKAGLVAQLEHVLSGLETKKKENAELLQKAGETSRYLQNLEMEKDHLKSQLASAREIETRLQLELSASQQNLNKAVSDLEAVTCQFQLHQEQANHEKAESKRRLEEKHQELLKVKIDYEELEDVLVKYDEKMKKREQEVQVEKLHLQKFIQVNEHEKAELEDKAKGCIELLGKLECLENALDYQKRELARGASERDNVVNVLERSKEELGKFVEEFVALSVDNKLEVEKIAEEKQVLEEQLRDLQHQLTCLADRNFRLNTELNGHVQQLKSVELENAKLLESLKTSQDELGKLKEELLKSSEESKKKAELAEQHEGALSSQLHDVQIQFHNLSKVKEQLLADLSNQAENGKQKHALEVELAEQRSFIFTGKQNEHMLACELAFHKQVKCLEEEKLDLIHELQEVRNQLQDLQEAVSKDIICTEVSGLDQSTINLRMQGGTVGQLFEENGEKNQWICNSEDVQGINKEIDELEDQHSELNAELQKAEGEHIRPPEALKSLDQITSLAVGKEPHAGFLFHEKKPSDLEEELQQIKDNLSTQVEIAMEQVEFLKKEKEQVVSQLENDKLCLQVCEEELAKCKNEAMFHRQITQESELRNTQLRKDLDAAFVYVHTLSDVIISSAFELECLKLQLTLITSENAEILRELKNSKHSFQKVDHEKIQLQKNLQKLRHQCMEDEKRIAFSRGYMDAMQHNSNNVKSQEPASQDFDMNPSLSDSEAQETTVWESNIENHSGKLELQELIQDIQHCTMKKDGGHLSESTLVKIEKTFGEMLSADQSVGSTNRIRSGVSKLIEAFEAKARTRDEFTIDISEQPANEDIVEGIGVSQIQQTGLRTDEGNLCQTDDLRQVEEDGAYLGGAQRQVEVEADFLKKKEEPEKMIGLLVEKNDQLMGQLVRCTTDIALFEIQALDLQERTAKELANFQDALEDLKEEVSQHALSLQAERTTYLVAISHLEKEMETVSQCVLSSFPTDSDHAVASSGADTCVELTTRLEALHNRLDGWKLGVSQVLIANQQEHDAAFELVHYVCMKLYQLLQLNKSSIIKEQKDAKRTAEAAKTEGIQEVWESRKSDVDLDGLRLECNNLVSELQQSLQEKFDLEALVRELTETLSGRDINIQELAMKFDELTVKYDLLCVQSEEDTKERAKLKDELHLIQQRFAEKSDLYTSLCLNVDALATKVLNATDLGLCNQITGSLSTDTNFLSSHITTLTERYISVFRELDELKEKMALKEAEATWLNEQVHKLDKELGTANKRNESLQQREEELAITRKDMERLESELMQTQQKLSITKEKLSVAVTKGKAVVQQRDALKKSLMENNVELQEVMRTYEHELKLKDAALHEAELNLRSCAEFEDRIDALQVQLRQVEEDRAYLGALREVEIKAGLLKQEELEKRMILLMEKNDQLVRQLVRGTVDIDFLESGMLDLQENAEKKLETFQQELENLKRASLEDALSLEAERNAYLDAIARLEKKMETIAQSALSSGSGFAVPFLGTETFVDNRTKKLGAILNLLDDWHLGVIELLAANQKERDAAFELLHSTCRKLFQALWLDHSNGAEEQKHVEYSEKEAKSDKTHKVWEHKIPCTDLGRLQLECNNLVNDLQKYLQEKFNLEAVVRESMAMLSGKEANIQEITARLDELTVKYDFMCAQVRRDTEEKLELQDELFLIQERLTEKSQLYDSLCSNINSLAAKVLDATNFRVPHDVTDNLSRDFSFLDFHITNLMEKYGSALRKLDELKNIMALKEAELIQLDEYACKLNIELDSASKERDRLNQCIEELTRTREKIEAEHMQTEQKLSVVKEKLSLAVTKGKAVVQQRDALKQSLMEKNTELEKLIHIHEHEILLKATALHEVELKLRSSAEFEGRIEALQSELAYIRNSANVLRESFLQKDAALQKVEDLLEDLDLPDDIHEKEIVEKIEWLVRTSNVPILIQQVDQKKSEEISGLCSGSPEITDHADALAVEALQQEQETEVLKRDYEDLLRKYRSLAEQSAMLEQSLLERNFLIQRWEEVLDTVDMPNGLRSMEPEDKIECLGRTLTETQKSVKQLQKDSQFSEGALELLRHDYDESCKQVNVLSTDLRSKTEEAEMLSTNLQNMTSKYELLTEKLEQVSAAMTDRESLETEVSVLQRNVAELVASQERKNSELVALQSVLVNTEKILLEVSEQSESASISSESPLCAGLESSVRRLVDNYKLVIVELENLRKQLTLMDKKKEESSILEQQSLQQVLGFRKRLEDATLSIESQEVEINDLRQQTARLIEELTFQKDEKDKLLLELTQAEQKSTSTREKLSMAVKKGKSVVQQRDALKQELDHVKLELQSQDAMLQEANQRLSQLEGAIDHAEKLKIELSISRDAAANMEHSLRETNTFIQRLAGSIHERIPWVSQSEDLIENVERLLKMHNESEEKAGYLEQESKNAKHAAELLAVELEEAHGELSSIRDEYMDVQKKISMLMEEKEVLEATKNELLLHLEDARANSNTLTKEVTGLKKFKADSQHEIYSLQEQLAVKMEEVRHEQIEADRKHRDLIELHVNMGNFKDELAQFLLTLAEDITENTKDMRKVEVLARNLASLIAVLNDSGSDSSFDFYTQITEQTSSVRTEIPVDEFPKGSLAMLENTKCWGHDGLTTAFRLQCQEMMENMEFFKEKFHYDTSALAQGAANMSNLLVQCCKACGSVAEKLEKMQIVVSRINVFEAMMQEREKHVSELQETVKYLSDSANSAIQDLEHLMSSLSPEQLKGSTNSDIAWQNPANGSEKLSCIVQEQLDTSKEYAINTSGRLLSIVRELFSIKEHTLCQENKELMVAKLQREETERKCEEMQGALRETQKMLNDLVSKEKSYKLKINDLEKVIASAQSNNVSLKHKLNEFQTNELTWRRMKDEIGSLQNLLMHKDEEREGLVKALHAAERKMEVLASKVEELEKLMQEKCILVESLETSRVKASNRLSATLNKLNGLQRMSEGMLLEIENLHKILENRDCEIHQLKQYCREAGDKVKVLQAVIDGKNDDVLQVKKRLLDMIHSFSPHSREKSLPPLESSEEGGLQELIQILDVRRSSLVGHAQELQAQLEKKDSLIQDVRYRYEEQLGKVNALHAIINEKQAHIERLSAQADVSKTADLILSSNEIEDLEQRGKLITPLTSAAPNLLNARKQSVIDHQVLDVGLDTSQINLDADDDKGHVFKTLTSSRFVPKASQILADRLDGFWVAGGRVLMRQPEARLCLIVYWFAMHVWIAASLL